MKRFFGLCLALSLLGAVAGCEKKAEVKKETTVTTPEGSATTTETEAVKTTGENPPAAVETK